MIRYVKTASGGYLGLYYVAGFQVGTSNPTPSGVLVYTVLALPDAIALDVYGTSRFESSAHAQAALDRLVEGLNQ